MLLCSVSVCVPVSQCSSLLSTCQVSILPSFLPSFLGAEEEQTVFRRVGSKAVGPSMLFKVSATSLNLGNHGSHPNAKLVLKLKPHRSWGLRSQLDVYDVV
ncbi:hypothetical protein JOB18_011470 [Solea senegalensis]|uniref:Uncharacterized protein n=1 Tax=Solea senegalensis TaxID=28829 RepID=A0AAV6S354_SOLSE|nr:hypothetical protein JOB18_011470 [Solea senegalensis]